MNNKLLLPALCFVALGIGFAAGRAIGAAAERSAQQLRTTYLAALNDLAEYRLFSELSQTIAAKREVSAQCTADLLASAKAKSIRACLAAAGCRDLMAAEVQKQAPDLLKPDGSLPFHYYADRETCPTPR